MTSLLALTMTPPPVPPPPLERIAAVEAVLRVAPVPPALNRQARDGAISGVAYGVFAKPTDFARIEPVRARLAERVGGDVRYGVRVTSCVVAALGWTYDLPTLQSIEQIVGTPGGRALWLNALTEPVARCHRETLAAYLGESGLAAALRWLARAQPAGALPSYSAGEGVAALAGRLQAFCGSVARAALVEQQGRLGIRAVWAEKGRNRPALACLVHGANLAGYELDEVQADGTRVTMIMAS